MDTIIIKDIFNSENNVLTQLLKVVKPDWNIIEFTPSIDPHKSIDNLKKLISSFAIQDEYGSYSDVILVGIGYSALLTELCKVKKLLVNPNFRPSLFLKQYTNKILSFNGNTSTLVSQEIINNYMRLELDQFSLYEQDWSDTLAVFTDDDNKEEYLRQHELYHISHYNNIDTNEFVANTIVPLLQWLDGDLERLKKNIPLSFEKLEDGVIAYAYNSNGEIGNYPFRITRFGVGRKWFEDNKVIYEQQQFADRDKKEILFPQIPQGVSPDDAPLVFGNWAGENWSAMYYGIGGVCGFSENFYIGDLLIQSEEEHSTKTYCDKFKDLLVEVQSGYIGHGNPNAKILFIGQEPALEYDSEQYNREIRHNSQEWINLAMNGFSEYDIMEYMNNFTEGKDEPNFFSPLHPWPLQKFQVRSGSEKNKNLKGKDGTSRTWYQYQTLINYILDKNETMFDGNLLDFHEYSFHTDMSAVSSKIHQERDLIKSRDSVLNRIPLFKHKYFQDFNIVIAAVGHFPKEMYGDTYFKKIFGQDLHYVGNLSTEGMPWINVSERGGDNPMILIHCPQLTYRVLTNSYLRRISEIIKEFIGKYYIDVYPAD